MICDLYKAAGCNAHRSVLGSHLDPGSPSLHFFVSPLLHSKHTEHSLHFLPAHGAAVARLDALAAGPADAAVDSRSVQKASRGGSRKADDA